MLVEFNCNPRAWWLGATATNMPVGSKQRFKHNQICVVVNMSADPMAMMPGQLVKRK